MKNSFTTICLLRNIFLATMCTWSSVNVERWPLWDMTFFLQQLLWDMTILRLDIFPTSTIMRHDHFETWNFSHTNHYEKRPFWDMFFCNYITWSTNIFFSTCAQQSAPKQSPPGLVFWTTNASWTKFEKSCYICLKYSSNGSTSFIYTTIGILRCTFDLGIVEPMNLLQMSCVITWAQKKFSLQPQKKEKRPFFSKKKFKLGFRPRNFSFEKKSFHSHLKNVN